MPTPARFGKVKLQMYFLERPPPHFHVTGPEFRVRVSIEILLVIDGTAPHSALTEALAWAARNRELLRAKWKELSE